MRKFSNLTLAVVAAGVLASQAVAKDGFFVGAETGFVRSQLNTHVYNDPAKFGVQKGIEQIRKTDTKDSRIATGFSGGLKVGYDLGFNRMYLGFGYTSADDTVTVESTDGSYSYDIILRHKMLDVVVGYDFLASITNGLKGVVGGFAGVERFVHSEKVLGRTFKMSKTAPVLGLKAGLNFEIDGHNSLEFGLKYQYTFKMKLQEEGYDFRYDGYVGSYRANVDGTLHNVGAFLSYVYKF